MSTPTQSQTLSQADPELHNLIQHEQKRQFEGLELIASEVSFFLCGAREHAEQHANTTLCLFANNGRCTTLVATAPSAAGCTAQPLHHTVQWLDIARFVSARRRTDQTRNTATAKRGQRESRIRKQLAHRRRALCCTLQLRNCCIRFIGFISRALRVASTRTRPSRPGNTACNSPACNLFFTNTSFYCRGTSLLATTSPFFNAAYHLDAHHTNTTYRI
jgi:hypothetical protein